MTSLGHPRLITVPGPCDGLCSNPTTYTSKPPMSITLTTAGTCVALLYDPAVYICGNSPTSFFINGTDCLLECNDTVIESLPSAINGGYCFQGTSTNGIAFLNF